MTAKRKSGANLAFHPAKPREALWGTAGLEYFVVLNGGDPLDYRNPRKLDGRMTKERSSAASYIVVLTFHCGVNAGSWGPLNCVR